MNLKSLFEQAILHQQIHNCSAHPYQSYKKLFELVAKAKPLRILEIGTGIGFTAVVMAKASSVAIVDSLEKNPEHAKLAKQFISQQGFSDRIIVHTVTAEELLPKLEKQYELIFFDGYQIHFEFLPQYQRLLVLGGILILGNNHLTSKTSDQFFLELNDSTQWQILEQFADTTVAKKL